MEKLLSEHSEKIYALLRIIVGLLFLCHGLQKFGVLGDIPPGMPDALRYAAGIIEVVGGGLVAVGFFTRWAAFISSGTMAVAYFMVHFSQGFFPLLNGGELAVVYCWLFLFIASKGSGIWSVEAIR